MMMMIIIIITIIIIIIIVQVVENKEIAGFSFQKKTSARSLKTPSIDHC
jgi:hypothetical protein